MVPFACDSEYHGNPKTAIVEILINLINMHSNQSSFNLRVLIHVTTYARVQASQSFSLGHDQQGI